jgi:arginine deiminase
MTRRKKEGNLRFRGQFLGTRIGLLEHNLAKRFQRRTKAEGTQKRIKAIREAENQATIWDNIWKYLTRQSKIKRNKKHIKEIEYSIEEAEINYNTMKNKAEKERKKLIDELRNP